MPDTSSFLRSINIGFDIADPSRIDHFRLTAKASTLLGSILGDDKSAILVTAPYGSGKSLTATCALQFVENTPAAQETLAGIARQAKRVPLKGTLILYRTRWPTHSPPLWIVLIIVVVSAVASKPS